MCEGICRSERESGKEGRRTERQISREGIVCVPLGRTWNGVRQMEGLPV